MLPCEFQGTLIHGMSSNGHRKIGRPEISNLVVQENGRSEKPISRDVAGSPSYPPTSVGIGTGMLTAKLQPDPISQSLATLDSSLL